MNIALVGSRKYEHPEDVQRLVAHIAQDDDRAWIVSGGAVGPDSAAEQAGIALGLGVLSFRPYKLSDESYGIEEWTMGGLEVNSVRRMTEQPTFADYTSALFYRNTLIVDAADRVVAFWNEWSEGTKFAIGYAKDRDKPVRIWTEKERVP